MLGRARGTQVGQVARVHREDQVELFEVFLAHTARALLIDLGITVRPRDLDRTRIGLFGGAAGVGASRVNGNRFGEHAPADAGLHHAGSHGRTADVAHADDKNSEHTDEGIKEKARTGRAFKRKPAGGGLCARSDPGAVRL